MMDCHDRPLSRLMLGTVQFGMPYGVANRTGQPEYRDVLGIVAAAVARLVEAGAHFFARGAQGTSSTPAFALARRASGKRRSLRRFM